MRLAEADRPADLDLRGRLEKAHILFADDHPHRREALIQLEELLARGDREELARLKRLKASVWLEWARREEGGFLRRLALGEALERANSADGTDELREEIRRLMQETDGGDLDWQTVSSEVEVPAAEMEAFFRAIVGDDGIAPALGRFGSWGPPTGDPAANASAVEAQLKEFVFPSLLPTTSLDDQGRPIRRFVTGEEKREHAMTRHETMLASFHGSLAALALDRIGERYAPERDELAGVFETALIGPQQAEPFARALGHYWDGSYDEAVHIVLPRIEAVLRRVLVAAGRIAYTEPRGGHAGHDKPLGAILNELGDVLPGEGWHRSAVVILTEPTGLNLRNRYMHGQIVRAEKEHAALVLHLAAYLRLRRTQQPALEE